MKVYDKRNIATEHDLRGHIISRFSASHVTREHTTNLKHYGFTDHPLLHLPVILHDGSCQFHS